MTTLKKYNLTGKEIGQVKINKELTESEANTQMIKDYIVALRANARQWSANTKGRSEVNHTTKKPHPQKGTGRARQGMLSAPQYKGGGRVFGPKPKFDQHVRINKKERRSAIRSLLADKIRENKLFVIEDTNLDEPKTKTIASFLNSLEINGKTLFLGEGCYLVLKHDESNAPLKVSLPREKHETFIKSVRNLPNAQFSLATNISGYDIICAQNIVLTEAALNEITEWLSQ